MLACKPISSTPETSDCGTPKICVVPNCESTQWHWKMENNIGKSAVFLKIPNNKIMRNLWLKSLGLNKFSSKNDTICHKHFNFDDFVPASQNHDFRGKPSLKPALKKEAIPTIEKSLKTKATTVKGICEEILKNAVICETTSKIKKKNYRMEVETVKSTSRFCPPEPR